MVVPFRNLMVFDAAQHIAWRNVQAFAWIWNFVMLIQELATIRGQLYAVQTALDGIHRSLTALEPENLSDREKDIVAVRQQVMPQGYFAETAWDILIQLDHARRHGKECVFPRGDVGNMVSESTQRRFLAALEADGIVEWEPAPDQPGRLLARLTEFGSASLLRIFSDAALLHTLNNSSLEGRQVQAAR